MACGSNVAEMAASNTTSTPNAYIPTPGTTVASCAIFTSATRIPSSMTSFIDHGCTLEAARISTPTHRGAGGRRDAESTTSMNAMNAPGTNHAQIATATAVTSLP